MHFANFSFGVGRALANLHIVAKQYILNTKLQDYKYKFFVRMGLFKLVIQIFFTQVLCCRVLCLGFQRKKVTDWKFVEYIYNISTYSRCIISMFF